MSVGTRPKGADIALAARGFTGTPYVFQGRKPLVGLDCVGVIICAAAECGVDLEEPEPYRRANRPARILRDLAAQLTKAPKSEADSGMVGVLRVSASQVHLGILDKHRDSLFLIEANDSPALRSVSRRIINSAEGLEAVYRIPGVRY